jgi:uncharacterized protein
MVICVRNKTRGTVLCSRAMIARSFRDRARGLMGRAQLSPHEGIVIEAERFLPLMWMHTFFMAFPIDIVFLGRGNAVIRIQPSLKPRRFSAIVFGARMAIEVSQGVAIRAGTAVGDLITLV